MTDTEPHEYLSTACHHGLHDRCRKNCKFCGAACKCQCHKFAGVATETGSNAGIRADLRPQVSPKVAIGRHLRRMKDFATVLADVVLLPDDSFVEQAGKITAALHAAGLEIMRRELLDDAVALLRGDVSGPAQAAAVIAEIEAARAALSTTRRAP